MLSFIAAVERELLFVGDQAGGGQEEFLKFERMAAQPLAAGEANRGIGGGVGPGGLRARLLARGWVRSSWGGCSGVVGEMGRVLEGRATARLLQAKTCTTRRVSLKLQKAPSAVQM